MKYKIPLPKNMFSYHEHNENKAGEKILDILQNNENIGYVQIAVVL